jgi:hypothetical protein
MKWFGYKGHFMPVLSLHFSLFEKAHPLHTIRDGVLLVPLASLLHEEMTWSFRSIFHDLWHERIS